MATWLVTGGAGFIGSNIVHRLAADGETVRVLDDFSSGRRSNLAGLPKGRVTIVEADLRDARAVDAAARKCDYVLHQGAVPSVPRSIADPDATVDVNVTGTLRVLEAARKSKSVRRVVFASSSSVYGDTPTLPKIESMPLQPLSPYAASKAAGESLCRAWTASMGVETTVLRYFNVFGPRQDPRSQYAAVMPRFFAALLAGEAPVIYGDGQQTRDFTYVDNVVEANLRAARTPKAAGEVLNVACGDRVTVAGLASMIGEVLGVPCKPRFEKGRGGEVRHSLAGVERMESILGFRPPVSLRDGLARTAPWYREAGRRKGKK
jgi:nucleoside-diphosphate-sugar epimerase